MKVYNPLEMRLSERFLLSDFMGCDSIYRFGYANLLTSSLGGCLAEGRELCLLLDSMVERYGPCSVSYGYLCPELTARIVKWHKADAPAYHSWSWGYGAAADLIFHDHVYMPLVTETEECIFDYQTVNRISSPIALAQKIDAQYRFERMITYSESPCICFATSQACNHSGSGKNNFYENRYMGERKPLHIKAPGRKIIRTDPNRTKYHELLPRDWRGQGWPSYHGKGRRQFHHIRVSRYTMLSDFLYNNMRVRKGVKNLPPLAYKVQMNKFIRAVYWAGKLVDAVVDETFDRVSVVDGYQHIGPKGRHNWEDRFELSIVPHCADLGEIAHVCIKLPYISRVEVMDSKIPYIRVKSIPLKGLRYDKQLGGWG